MPVMAVTDFLEKTAKRLPDKTAFVDPERSLTFKELQAEAKHTAAALIRAGLLRKPVAVFMEKSASTVAAVLGVAYSGNFFTILDTKMPAERAEKILGTLEPQAFITTKALEEKCSALAGSIPVFIYEETQSAEMNPLFVKERTDKVLPSDVLYVLFTSGSTGTPKGVVTSHQAVVDFLTMASGRSYGNDEHDVILNQAPLYFVMALPDMLTPIAFGSTTHFINELAYAFPGMLMKYIDDHKITQLGWVTSAMQLCVNMKALDSADLSTIDTVIFGGEVMPIPVLRAWRKKLPNARFFNSYGSTETTAACLHYLVDRDFPDDAMLPVGVPDGNMDILLLDEEDHLVPDGETGEICVRSSSLSYGYYKDPERTAEVFMQNPLQTAFEEKIFRTGDLAYKNDRGELEFVGRKDLQVKFMGHRIELGEIEAAALTVPGVLENACAYDPDAKKIVLFFTGNVEGKELRKALSGKLPDYMVPRKFIPLESMPRNAHDKVDRVRLKAMAKEMSGKK